MTKQLILFQGMYILRMLLLRKRQVREKEKFVCFRQELLVSIYRFRYLKVKELSHRLQNWNWIKQAQIIQMKNKVILKRMAVAGQIK